MAAVKKGRRPADWGRIYTRAGSSQLWVDYRVNGKRHRYPAGKTEAEAEAHLNEKWLEVASEEFIEPKDERATVEDLLESLIEWKQMMGQRAIRTDRIHAKPVIAELGRIRAKALSSERIIKYILMRDRKSVV